MPYLPIRIDSLAFSCLSSRALVLVLRQKKKKVLAPQGILTSSSRNAAEKQNKGSSNAIASLTLAESTTKKVHKLRYDKLFKVRHLLTTLVEKYLPYTRLVFRGWFTTPQTDPSNDKRHVPFHFRGHTCTETRQNYYHVQLLMLAYSNWRTY